MTGKKRKAYGVVVGLCATALLVDRFVLTDSVSGPANVEASQVRASSGNPVEGEADRRPVPRIAFPDVGGDLELRPPPDFFARVDARPSTAHSAEGGGDGNHLLRAAFEKSVKLEGVMLTEGVSIAVVNGTRMRRGDSFKGCKLENIFGRSVRFQCSDGQAVLFIAPRGLHAGS